MNATSISWEVIRVVCIGLLLLTIFFRARDIKKEKNPQSKRKLITVHVIVGVAGIGLYFAITQLGIGNFLWPVETIDYFPGVSLGG